MGLADISLKRPITSYSKVQRLIAPLIRGRRFQLRSSRVASKEYLDVGCGPTSHELFISLEWLWHPGVDLCWDITKGIPLADGSLKGIFSEHCLEHFSLPQVRFLLKEFRRLLRPGGTCRLIVPDAGLYLDVYARRMAGDGTAQFPYQGADDVTGLRSPLIGVNRIFYTDRDSFAGHRCMYDATLLGELLTEAGFVDVRKEKFREGRDSVLLVDAEHRAVESLYMEGTAG